MSDTKKPNIGLILNFDLLGTNLNAAYEKDGNKQKALLLPSSVEESNGVNLGEMVKSFKDAIGVEINTDIIKNNVGSADKDKKFDWEKIKFQLKMAYLYMDKDAAKTNTDYAFAIKVDLADAVPDLGFLKVNNIGLAVWNTEKPGVLSKMNMGTISNLLKTLEAK